jgi:hypothetical protein
VGVSLWYLPRGISGLQLSGCVPSFSESTFSFFVFGRRCANTEDAVGSSNLNYGLSVSFTNNDELSAYTFTT